MFQKETATIDLTELVDRYNLLEKLGAGTYYHALSRIITQRFRIITHNHAKSRKTMKCE